MPCRPNQGQNDAPPTDQTTGTAMNLTLNKASTAAKKGKSALLNAIKKGRLAAKKNELGEWEIDPAELFRLYPSEPVQENRAKPEAIPQSNREAALEAALKAVTAERDRLIGDLAATRQEAQEWRLTIKALLPPPKAENAPTGKKTGFWGRLFGNAA